MKAEKVVEVALHAVSTSVLSRREWSASRSYRTIVTKKPVPTGKETGLVYVIFLNI
jgi:hypothetical protein